MALSATGMLEGLKLDMQDDYEVNETDNPESKPLLARRQGSSKLD